MRRPEPDQRLTDQGRKLVRQEPTAVLDAVGQRIAVQELHDDVAIAVRQNAQVEHLQDVIVADATSGLRLTFEALHHLGVAGERGVQDLDRHAAIDAHVLALEDGAHAALADQPDDAVLVVYELADFERHRGASSRRIPVRELYDEAPTGRQAPPRAAFTRPLRQRAARRFYPARQCFRGANRCGSWARWRWNRFRRR